MPVAYLFLAMSVATASIFAAMDRPPEDPDRTIVSDSAQSSEQGMAGVVQLAGHRQADESQAKEQEGPDTAPGRPESAARHETRVFPVRNLDLIETINTLQNVFRINRMAPLEQTQSIVVRDAPEILDEIEQLLNALGSTAHANPSTGEDAVVYTLKHRDPETVADMLNSLYHRVPQVRILADSDSGKLIVRSRMPEGAKIRSLIEQLDEETNSTSNRQTLVITCDFMLARAGATGAGSLPANLKEVGAELAATGLGDLRLTAHLMFRAIENEEFSGNGRSREGAAISIQGQVEVEEGLPTLSLKWNILAPVTTQWPTDDQQPDTHYGDIKLKTTLRVPLGDYAVVGAVPAAIGDADTLLLVTRITPG